MDCVDHSSSQQHSRASGLQAEFFPGHPGGLKGKVLVTLRLLPHVVILHALPDRARAYLAGRDTTAAARVVGIKSSYAGAADLTLLA